MIGAVKVLVHFFIALVFMASLLAACLVLIGIWVL